MFRVNNKDTNNIYLLNVEYKQIAIEKQKNFYIVKVACMVDKKKIFMDWFCYKLIVLIK